MKRRLLRFYMRNEDGYVHVTMILESNNFIEVEINSAASKILTDYTNEAAEKSTNTITNTIYIPQT